MTTPDPKILAAAITRMEAEIALFPEAEFPVEHEQTRAVVAAAKAYQPMREALEAANREMWESARHQWVMADFKNWAVIQQIDAALKINGDL